MSTRKRTNFTESQKAEIFARDRATCSFTGVSMWIPDQGLTPEWDNDWADHLKPSARGGTSTLENGACVSSTYNIKKRDNGHDNRCFFRAGMITRDYVRVFGLPSKSLLDDLERRAALVPADWHFNRAIANSLIALEWRVREMRGARRYTRDDRYWISSAQRRHACWKRSRSPDPFASRGLLTQPEPYGTTALLALETVETESHYSDWLESLWPSYSNTALLIHAFDTADDDVGRQAVLDSAGKADDINPQVVEALTMLAGTARAAA